MASFLLVLAVLAMAPAAVAVGSEEIDRSTVIGVIPLTSDGITRNVYRRIDRLVPTLRNLSSDGVVKLECRYTGMPEREHDVLNAYKIAGQVEKYLKERHKIKLDIWIAANIGTKSHGNPPALTFSVLPGDVRKLEKLPVHPVKTAPE
jgi:hypothetical protein